MSPAPTAGNVARHLVQRARSAPGATAVIEARGGARSTWPELDARSDAIAHGLAGRGLGPGERVALFVRPGIDLVALVYGLFKLGAVPVLLDPGMGTQAIAGCLAKVRPVALVGVPRAHLLRLVARRGLASVRLSVVVGPRRLPGLETLRSLERPSAGAFPPRDPAPDDPAAILFTSGSTGPPKGVVYTHPIFEAQVRALRELYAFEEGEVDLACFPLFALFGPALGLAALFPDLDASRPGDCEPARLVRAAREHGATTSFGSPAIWRRVVPWCRASGERLETLRRVLIAGAPVRPSLVEGFGGLLAPGGEVHTPYGATEALPLASIPGADILARRHRAETGAGACVGRAAPGVELALVPVTDEPLGAWPGTSALGEICARGALVTRAYEGDEEATRAAKIPDGDSSWHRTGDVGYLDDEGLLWFCGRKAHRLETAEGLVLPDPAEAVFDLHPRVARTALVGLGARGRERAALVVEAAGDDALARELLELYEIRRRAAPPRAARVEQVLFRRSLPVDARHNAKLRREEIRAWAQGRAR